MQRTSQRAVIALISSLPALMGARGCFGGEMDLGGPAAAGSSAAHPGSAGNTFTVNQLANGGTAGLPGSDGSSVEVVNGGSTAAGASLARGGAMTAGGSPTAYGGAGAADHLSQRPSPCVDRSDLDCDAWLSRCDGGIGPDCPPPDSCRAQDASGMVILDVARPTTALGYFWTGSECAEVRGHECGGADCKALYASYAECQAATRNCTAVQGTPLIMDPGGWVSGDSNPWGIQGSWYAASDQSDGGGTRIDVGEGEVPFENRRGMCITGTEPAGPDDDYASWGALIGLNLNQSDPLSEGLPLPNGPRCYTIVLSQSATAPSPIRVDLLPKSKLEPWVPPLSKDLRPGGNEVCVDNVNQPAYCEESMGCLGPESLAGGVAALQIVAPAGGAPGPVDFCVEAIIPHD